MGLEYVVLLHFYVSILKKHKNTKLNKIKKNLVEYFYHEISNHRQFKFRSNFKWVKCQIDNLKKMLRLQHFYNKSQVVSCYWFKFETNTKITFLP